MAFRAVHAHWGIVLAHLPDLGYGQEAVWKVRPPAPLTCDECHHPMYAKTSRLGFRFFAHAPGAPTCALALETLAHHMLKLELSNAARDAGSHAEIEVRSPTAPGGPTSWHPTTAAPGGWRWKPSSRTSLTPTSLIAPSGCAPTASPRSGSPTDRARHGWVSCLPHASPGPRQPAPGHRRGPGEV